MKRVHRHWHRRIWGVLLPVLLPMLLVLYHTRTEPPAPNDLPTAVVNTAEAP